MGKEQPHRDMQLSRGGKCLMANNSNNKRNYCKPTPKHCNRENNLPSEFYQVERTITDINNLIDEIIKEHEQELLNK